MVSTSINKVINSDLNIAVDMPSIAFKVVTIMNLNTQGTAVFRFNEQIL